MSLLPLQPFKKLLHVGKEFGTLKVNKVTQAGLPDMDIERAMQSKEAKDRLRFLAARGFPHVGIQRKNPQHLAVKVRSDDGRSYMAETWTGGEILGALDAICQRMEADLKKKQEEGNGRTPERPGL